MHYRNRKAVLLAACVVAGLAGLGPSAAQERVQLPTASPDPGPVLQGRVL
jgi:hypothetical protein